MNVAVMNDLRMASVLDVLPLDCCVIRLVFLQVLFPFCPWSELSDSEPVETEVDRPACTTAELITSQTDLTSSPLLSYTSSLTHTPPPLSKTPSVPLTVLDSSSLISDARSASPVPSDSASVTQRGLVSLLSLSNSPLSPQSEAFSDDSVSYTTPHTQTDPPHSTHSTEALSTPSLSDSLSDESSLTCTQVDSFPVNIP